MDNKIFIDPNFIRNLPNNSIVDAEIIRQIALWSIENNDNSLNCKIRKEFQFAGLYPHIITELNIKPDTKK